MKTIDDLKREGILNERIEKHLNNLTSSQSINKACIHLLVKKNLAERNFTKYKRKNPDFKKDLAYILNNLDLFHKNEFKFKIAGKLNRKGIRDEIFKPIKPKRRKKLQPTTAIRNIYSLYARIKSVPM